MDRFSNIIICLFEPCNPSDFTFLTLRNIDITLQRLFCSLLLVRAQVENMNMDNEGFFVHARVYSSRKFTLKRKQYQYQCFSAFRNIHGKLTYVSVGLHL